MLRPETSVSATVAAVYSCSAVEQTALCACSSAYNSCVVHYLAARIAVLMVTVQTMDPYIETSGSKEEAMLSPDTELLHLVQTNGPVVINSLPLMLIMTCN